MQTIFMEIEIFTWQILEIHSLNIEGFTVNTNENMRFVHQIC